MEKFRFNSDRASATVCGLRMPRELAGKIRAIAARESAPLQNVLQVLLEVAVIEYEVTSPLGEQEVARWAAREDARVKTPTPPPVAEYDDIEAAMTAIEQEGNSGL